MSAESFIRIEARSASKGIVHRPCSGGACGNLARHPHHQPQHHRNQRSHDEQGAEAEPR